MKIILTSSGFENIESLCKIEKILNKSFDRIKMLVIPIARKYEYNKKKYLEDYISIGFKEENISFFNDEEPEKYRKLNLDLIYVCGGNTFLLKDCLKKSDFEKDIIEYVNNGVVYLGASAGTHIATKSIEHVKYFDENEVNIRDFNGLNLYPGIVICHYNDTRKKIYEELKTKYNKVETISDNEILYSKDKEWIKI